MKDLESGSQDEMAIKRSKSAKNGKEWCQICQLEVDITACHCSDCEVCIEQFDHHCVLFSKCIGGGNMYCFWGTIGGVVFNFTNIAIMLACTAFAGQQILPDVDEANLIAKQVSDHLKNIVGVPVP